MHRPATTATDTDTHTHLLVVLEHSDAELRFDLCCFGEAWVVVGARRVGEDQHAVAKHSFALVQRLLVEPSIHKQ